MSFGADDKNNCCKARKECKRLLKLRGRGESLCGEGDGWEEEEAVVVVLESVCESVVGEDQKNIWKCKKRCRALTLSH